MTDLGSFKVVGFEGIMEDEKLKAELEEYVMSRLEVMDRAKAVLSFPSEETASVQQAAWLYKVDKKVIYEVVHEFLDELASDGYKNGIFTRRAILRVSMLLEGNEVANEVRTQLLNLSN